MPSCEERTFVPLGGAEPDDDFRPFGMPAPEPEAAPPPPPEIDPLETAFEAGHAAGRREAEAERAVLAADVASVVDAVHGWRDELRTRYTETVVALGFAAARRIVGEALDADPARWVPIVGDAIRRLVDRERVTVRVAPRLAALLRAHASALAGDDASEVRVVEDATLAAGACRIESRMGDVDCGLDTQLAAVAEVLGLGTERGGG
jgi:flagellar biosynthesis/type III secretory pathway protein FliH